MMVLNIKAQVQVVVTVLMLPAAVMTLLPDVNNDDHHAIAQAKYLQSYKSIVKLLNEVNDHFDVSNTAMHRSEIDVHSPDNEIHRKVEFKKRSAEEYNSLADLNNQNITLQQRSRRSLPWLCRSTTNWKDLGILHYPRFLKEILCLSNDCMHGAYSCRPQIYPVKVLSAREVGYPVDIGLPLELRSAWKLAESNVSVGCMCGI